jgi:hypothetical protein
VGVFDQRGLHLLTHLQERFSSRDRVGTKNAGALPEARIC